MYILLFPHLVGSITHVPHRLYNQIDVDFIVPIFTWVRKPKFFIYI